MTETQNQGAEWSNAVEQAATVLANRYESSHRYHQVEVELLARAVIAMDSKLSDINLANTDQTRSIENDLVEALKDDIDDYSTATRSRAAVHRAVGALRARDTKIVELEDSLHAARAEIEQLREELEHARRLAREHE